MKHIVRWTCKGAYGLFVALALAFGTSQAFAATTLIECPDPVDGFIGYCPPYSNETCEGTCIGSYGYQSGHCFAGACCVCMI